MTQTEQDRLHDACLQFADGVALMTREQFGEAYQRLCGAYDLLMEIHRDPVNPDVLHVDIFRNAVVLAGAELEVPRSPEIDAARGMLTAWLGCRSSALGTDVYNRNGRLTQQALDHYRQAVSHFEAAIPLLEAGLGHDHPELQGPLGDYSGNLRAVGREVEADQIFQRVVALPPTALSPAMIGGGYPIVMLDPFGSNPLLPSQTA